jgi:hypothetical protein
VTGEPEPKCPRYTDGGDAGEAGGAIRGVADAGGTTRGTDCAGAAVRGADCVGGAIRGADPIGGAIRGTAFGTNRGWPGCVPLGWGWRMVGGRTPGS